MLYALSCNMPINITNNDTLLQEAKKHNWRGNGTFNNPIVITDIEDGIFVNHTTLHVIIANNTFNGKQLLIDDAQNICIMNNIFTGIAQNTRIVIFNSKNIIIAHNTFLTDVRDTHIYINACKHLYMIYNYVFDTQTHNTLYYSNITDGFIYNNVIINTRTYKRIFEFVTTANRIIILNNTIITNDNSTFILKTAHASIIANNIIYKSSTPIYIEYPTRSITIYNNYEFRCGTELLLTPPKDYDINTINNISYFKLNR